MSVAGRASRCGAVLSLLPLCCVCVLAAVAAGAASAQAWQAELGAGAESLSGGRPGWRQHDAALRWRLAPRALLEGSARSTERFDLRDREWGAGLAAPIGGAWSGALSIAVSPTHRVLPHGSAGAQLQRALAGGWLLGIGWKRTRYDVSSTTGLTLGAERYWRDWRGAAAWIHTRVDGGAATDALRLQLDRSFGEQSRLGIVVAAGREIDDLGVSQLTLSRVESVAVLGRWQFAPRWAAVGDLGTQRVGSLYRRSGGRLGVQLDF